MDAGEKKTVLVIIGAAAAWFFFYAQLFGGNAPVPDSYGGFDLPGGTDSTFVDEVYVSVLGVPEYINAWADAITRHEGWAPGTRSFRNNNPGNLRVVGDQGQDAGGFGIFSHYQLGRAALISDLSAKVRKYSTWSLYQVMSRYAPPSENNTAAYAAGVAASLGCTIDAPVGSLAALWQQNAYQYQGAPFTASDGVVYA